jgi:chromosome segregation ATPase
MTPNEDDDVPFEDPRDADPAVREFRLEIARLQAQIDQLAAASSDRNLEVAKLRERLAELEAIVERLRRRYRQIVRLWASIALMYGTMIGLALNYRWR